MLRAPGGERRAGREPYLGSGGSTAVELTWDWSMAGGDILSGYTAHCQSANDTRHAYQQKQPLHLHLV